MSKQSDLAQVPADVLLSAELSASAKLVWMIAQLRPTPDLPGTAWFTATSGLSHPTVLTALVKLAASGWPMVPAVPLPAGSARAVPVPADLLTNRRLSIAARVLYGQLLLTPGFSHPGGKFTYADLANHTHTSPNTLNKALAELTRAEWIQTERAHRLAPICFHVTFPGFARGLQAVAEAEARMEGVPFGEALMREYLTLLIDSDDYQDNASPGFLVRPRTEHLLQFDRFYPPRVAFEHNGPQHYRTTAKYPDPAVLADQRERDYIKLGICAERGITLVIIRPEDLTLQGMRDKIPRFLPARDLAGQDILIDYLETESRTYRKVAAKI